MNNISQRDAFWNKVYEIAVRDRDVVIVAADMGAPSLDKFKKDLPGQFVSVGIAEQNGVLVASGLALCGKKPFLYAIAPFVTLRCLEQMRVSAAIMNIPVTLVGVGAGFGYEDSGPTHHIIEDIAIMRSMPNIVTHSITDSVMASAVADISCRGKAPRYIRVDRQVLPQIYSEGSDFSRGLSVVKEGSDAIIVATGVMTHHALDIAKKLQEKGANVGVLDAYCFPIDEEAFLGEVGKAKKIITLEEHFLPGGLGSAVCEILADHRVAAPVKRLGLPTQKGYCYAYGGRETIWRYYGVDRATVEKEIIGFVRS